MEVEVEGMIEDIPQETEKELTIEKVPENPVIEIEIILLPLLPPHQEIQYIMKM